MLSLTPGSPLSTTSNGTKRSNRGIVECARSHVHRERRMLAVGDVRRDDAVPRTSDRSNPHKTCSPWPAAAEVLGDKRDVGRVTGPGVGVRDVARRLGAGPFPANAAGMTRAAASTDSAGRIRSFLHEFPFVFEAINGDRLTPLACPRLASPDRTRLGQPRGYPTRNVLVGVVPRD